ncbi:OLC1v1031088C3 [Oldenlandia corymbosa var. corymbosa]|uniref:4-coumarate--CoA ligase n=1 Tax=Oldenlandia corymbosa var. corymbosa TaxID=529605 RepID=A0AAV1CI73_OLDCO|nr:OLC1v1031088C3 [Oldenlandia corymbosa var. corymbosa]
MSTFSKPSQFSGGDEETIFHTTYKSKKVSYPPWYSPETGVYQSKYPPVPLPSDPFLDVVSFIFSHKHDGLTALVDSSSGFSLSYSKILPLVKSIASGLHQMGVSQGDVVLISVPNSIHFPIIFLGVLAVGAIATAINPLSSLSEIKKQVLDCKPSFGFCSPERVGEFSPLGFPVIGVPSTEFLMSESQHYKDSDFLKLISSDPNSAPRPKINQQDAAAILYSSGTTGSCKGTVLTHGNFIASVVQFVRFEASTYAESPSTNVYLASLPMFHVYGLALFVMGLLSLGTRIVVMRKFDADEMIRAIDKYGVTHFPTVPPIVLKLTKMAKEAPSGGSFKSLRQISCGAAPVTGKSIEDFVQTFPHVDFIQGYGMTETTAVGTRGYNTEKFRNYGSIGLLAPSVQAKVVNWTTGSVLPPGKTGELWIRSAGNMKGYLNNEEATKSAIDKDGWLRTGDIAFFDKDGYVYVVDRLKEIIKFKGFQIAPADLESVLVSHPQIVDAAVTGARDEEAGEIPVAFVVRKEGSGLSEAAVIDFVSKQVTE